MLSSKAGGATTSAASGGAAETSSVSGVVGGAGAGAAMAVALGVELAIDVGAQAAQAISSAQVSAGSAITGARRWGPISAPGPGAIGDGKQAIRGAVHMRFRDDTGI